MAYSTQVRPQKTEFHPAKLMFFPTLPFTECPGIVCFQAIVSIVINIRTVIAAD